MEAQEAYAHPIDTSFNPIQNQALQIEVPSGIQQLPPTTQTPLNPNQNITIEIPNTIGNVQMDTTDLDRRGDSPIDAPEFQDESGVGNYGSGYVANYTRDQDSEEKNNKLGEILSGSSKGEEAEERDSDIEEIRQEANEGEQLASSQQQTSSKFTHASRSREKEPVLVAAVRSQGTSLSKEDTVARGLPQLFTPRLLE